MKSEPTSVAASADLFEEKIPKTKQSLLAPFSLLWTKPTINSIILFGTCSANLSVKSGQTHVEMFEMSNIQLPHFYKNRAHIFC